MRFTLYTWNGGRWSPLKRLTLYFRVGEGEARHLVFLGDRLRTHVYPGQWTHVVVSWDADAVDLYLDGRHAGRLVESLATEHTRGVCSELLIPHYHEKLKLDELTVGGTQS